MAVANPSPLSTGRAHSIKICTKQHGVHTVRAQSVAPCIAIHPALGGGSHWTITHTRTGLMVHTGISTKDAALVIASRIAHLDWDFDDPMQCPPDTRREVRRLTACPPELDTAAAHRRVWDRARHALWASQWGVVMSTSTPVEVL